MFCSICCFFFNAHIKFWSCACNFNLSSQFLILLEVQKLFFVFPSFVPHLFNLFKFLGYGTLATTSQVSSFTPHKHGCSNLDFFKVGINIKSILIGMYNYFVHSDKWHIELCKLVELFKAKRNKIFKKLKKLKHLCYYQ